MTTGKLRPDKPFVFVISGIQAAGKSTIARLLAGRFEYGVHLEADALQKMIVSGGEWVSKPGEPAGEAARQLQLRLKHMCLLARSFYEAGFTVALDDLILGERWHELQAGLQDIPFTLVVLAPRVETVLKRDENRAKATLGEEWARYLDEILRVTMAGTGLWLDNTGQTPDETVDQILAAVLNLQPDDKLTT